MGSTWKMINLFIYLICSIVNVSCTNYLSYSNETSRGLKNSFFGYSVAMYINRAGDYYSLVGAPRMDPIDGSRIIGEPGAIVFADHRDDTKKYFSVEREYVNKTIVALGTVGRCFMIDNFDGKSLDTVQGTKGTPADDLSFPGDVNFFGYSMNGFSVDFTQYRNYDMAIMGSPGAFYMHGGFLLDSPTDNNKKMWARFNEDTKLYFDNNCPGYTKGSQKNNRMCPSDANYLGYSVKRVNMADDMTTLYVAAGLPAGNMYYGEVKVYPALRVKDLRADFVKMNIYDNITSLKGETLGSYFGSSIAVTDLNNDGTDDLIVGAPCYELSIKDKAVGTVQRFYDAGRIYIYLQKNGKFELSFTYSPNVTMARFGHAITAAGDVNKDGFNDIIVSAPFYKINDKTSGAVYLFHGSDTKEGLKKEPIQIIKSQEGVQSFGYSLGANRDVDNNGYPDFVVGAPLSDLVALFRARVLIRVEGIVQAPVERRTMNIDKGGRCGSSKQDGTENVCGVVDVTLRVNNLTKYTNLGGFVSLNIELDATKGDLEKRVHFVGSDDDRSLIKSGATKRESTVSLKNVWNLRQAMENRPNNGYISINFVIFYDFNNEIYDKMTPIEIVVTPTYKDRSVRKRTKRSDQWRQLENDPVADFGDKESFRTTIHLNKNCGDDGVCEADLVIMKTDILVCQQNNVCGHKDTFALASDHSVLLTSTVRNKGDDAFNAQLTLVIPSAFTYNSYTTIDKDNVTKSVICTEASNENGYANAIECDIGNPLGKGVEVTIQFKLTVDVANLDSKSQMFLMLANSTNIEGNDTKGDNRYEKKLDFNITPDLKFIGNKRESFPETIYYSADDHREDDKIQWTEQVGPRVTHVYEVRNDGPNEINEVIMDIYWPSKSATGNADLLYLFRKPQISHGTGECRFIPSAIANHRSLSISEYDELSDTRAKRDILAQVKSRWLMQDEHQEHYQVIMSNKTIQRSKRQNDEDETYSMPVKAYRELMKKFEQLVTFVKDKKENFQDPLKKSEMNCNDLNCDKMTCSLRGLKAFNDSEYNYMTVAIDSYLWINTVIDQAIYMGEITSIASITPGGFPDAILATMDLPILWASVTTEIVPRDPRRVKRAIPWWLWFIAILAGIVFLLLVILLLWKCGFFNRNRPDKSNMYQAKKERAPDADYYGFPREGSHL